MQESILAWLWPHSNLVFWMRQYFNPQPFHRESSLLATTSVFFNLGSAEPRDSANSLLGTLEKLFIVLYGTFRFHQMIRNFQEVPTLEKGWKTLHYVDRNDAQNIENIAPIYQLTNSAQSFTNAPQVRLFFLA